MNKQKRENITFIVKCQLISSIEIEGTVEFEKKKTKFGEHYHHFI